MMYKKILLVCATLPTICLIYYFIKKRKPAIDNDSLTQKQEYKPIVNNLKQMKCYKRNTNIVKQNNFYGFKDTYS
jgi:hypothetical protein